jgi:hypothetical protein
MPRPGPRTTARYSEHFKATAVRLSQLPGVAVQDVAEVKQIRRLDAGVLSYIHYRSWSTSGIPPKRLRTFASTVCDLRMRRSR